MGYTVECFVEVDVGVICGVAGQGECLKEIVVVVGAMVVAFTT